LTEIYTLYVKDNSIKWAGCGLLVSSTIATDNSMGSYIIHYSIELIAFSAEYTLFNNCNFTRVIPKVMSNVA